MDPVAVFILICVAVMIIWLCYAVNKSDSEETKKSDYAPKIISDDLSKKITSDVVENEKKPSPYVTVYQYQAAQKVKICPYCDGENTQTATVCEICGDKI